MLKLNYYSVSANPRAGLNIACQTILFTMDEVVLWWGLLGWSMGTLSTNMWLEVMFMWSILIIILNILYQLCGHEQINIIMIIPCDIPLDGILDYEQYFTRVSYVSKQSQ